MGDGLNHETGMHASGGSGASAFAPGSLGDDAHEALRRTGKPFQPDEARVFVDAFWLMLPPAARSELVKVEGERVSAMLVLAKLLPVKAKYAIRKCCVVAECLGIMERQNKAWYAHVRTPRAERRGRRPRRVGAGYLAASAPVERWSVAVRTLRRWLKVFALGGFWALCQDSRGRRVRIKPQRQPTKADTDGVESGGPSAAREVSDAARRNEHLRRGQRDN